MRGGDDFLDGFNLGGNWLDHDALSAQPVEDLFAVEPSRLRAPGRCICCPKCKGLQVGRRDNGEAEGVTRWQCLDPVCKHGWKEASALKVIRCYVVIDT